ncbi:SLC25A32 [Lepeophtheirus salmonis]|uniref:SLC25A32 n=1 Tax=Lepeophtheirus salmonis TaxID=72036 RepID=A0A7R8CLQ2_LEPSM|nr:SLC25A32 [Lepeophtheirus salmonis]CAF2857910.1 SLC25A32 [Lepeophtheirus salmonis]
MGTYFLFYNRVKSIQQKGCAYNLIRLQKITLYAYKGMFDAFRRILKAEGLPGLYKGFVPGIFGVSHGVDDKPKSHHLFYLSRENSLIYLSFIYPTCMETYEYLAFSALSKFIAALTTYPYQVVRARLQDRNSQYTGSWDCVKHTYRDESFRGFYKGLVPNLMRVIPATAITFLSYESIFLNKHAI